MTDNLIGDRYVLGPLLGRGGMAEVRRARDTRLERDVAIKRLKPELANDPIFLERFRREAHSAAGLNHPNIVSVFDTGESFDSITGMMIPYIVMELVVGHTLREILHDGRKIQPIKALEITQSILDALDYSHRHGIIHRDIKPANVMLTNTGQVKVMDFGIARAVSDTAASMTQTASVIGTPQYLSPEQIRGETVDRRSDIYAVGCLLYELLTAKPPFEGDSPVSLAYQHVRATPVPPSEVDPLVSGQMDAIVLKALAKNPSDRYQTAHEMEEDITRLLAGQKVLATIPPALADEAPTQVLVPGAADKTQVMSTTQVVTASKPAANRPAARAADPEEDEPHNHLGRIIGIVLGALLVLALIAAGIIWALNRSNNPNPIAESTAPVTVPCVETMAQANAEQQLQDKGWKTTVQTFNGPDDNTVGTVTTQDPGCETSAMPGSTVALRVNIGQEKVVVPDVREKTETEAKQILKDAGFTTITSTPATEAQAGGKPAGTVVGQDPTGGGKVATSTLITLMVATGTLSMPDVTGAGDAATAQQQLAEQGFTSVTLKSVEVGDDTHVGTFTTNPGAGSPVSKDTAIIISVADTMPNLVSYDVDQTLTTLGSWGFPAANITKQGEESSSAKNSITATDPAAGRPVTKDTPIKLTYSLGAKPSGNQSTHGTSSPAGPQS
ncbi:MAG: Stk1 family PASTA domain-containing Ser/Thr kinase [Propionibacteriaceae bacterium]|jgi:serine/threonine-protein kinase|nr:Stk1 family PASTA domain-containing Ser/Thr kinase [Propionibacteriaceae bacterium]